VAGLAGLAGLAVVLAQVVVVTLEAVAPQGAGDVETH